MENKDMLITSNIFNYSLVVKVRGLKNVYDGFGDAPLFLEDDDYLPPMVKLQKIVTDGRKIENYKWSMQLLLRLGNLL